MAAVKAQRTPLVVIVATIFCLLHLLESLINMIEQLLQQLIGVHPIVTVEPFFFYTFSFGGDGDGYRVPD
jgi:hypothetical protein